MSGRAIHFSASNSVDRTAVCRRPGALCLTDRKAGVTCKRCIKLLPQCLEPGEQHTLAYHQRRARP